MVPDGKARLQPFMVSKYLYTHKLERITWLVTASHFLKIHIASCLKAYLPDSRGWEARLRIL